jgi:hypothetical protein
MSRQAKFIFWDITPYSLLKVNMRFGVICRLLLQGNMGVSRPLRYIPPQETPMFIFTIVRTENLANGRLFCVSCNYSAIIWNIASNRGTIEELETVWNESAWSGYCSGVAWKDCHRCPQLEIRTWDPQNTILWRCRCDILLVHSVRLFENVF